MDPLIRILHLEDDPADVELVQAKLEDAGLACRITRVQTRDEFGEALRQDENDIILADYQLPMYDGMSALQLVQKLCPDVPFIFVSGTMGEEAAIEGLTEGATDYVLKQNLLRLGSAVKRALNEAKNRRERKRAQSALQESEAKMRSILENIGIGVALINPKMEILEINRRMREWCPAIDAGQRPICYRAFKDPPREEVCDYCPTYKTLLDGLVHEATTQTQQAGVIRDYRIVSSPLLNKAGEVTASITMVEDITKRKRAEDALRNSEREKTILNQIANIFLTIPDEAMYGEVLTVVLQVMKSKFGVFGYIGETGDLIIPSMTREIWNECQVSDKSIVFPSDSWGNSLWGRAIREKKAFCTDGPFRTPEGHIHIDHFLCVPIIYGQETIGLISVANKEGGYTEEDKDLLERIVRKVSPILRARLQRNIEERMRMAVEGALRESEEKYRLLITNADEAIFIVQDEIVKFPNPKALEMTGYSAKELAKIAFIDLIHPGDKSKVFDGYLRPLEGKQRREGYPFRIIDKNGKEMWGQLTTVPIVWEKKPGILCFLRDITEEKKLEARFMQAQKMEAVGRLAGGVAHDFNNMLGVIIGHTELAMDRLDPSHELFANLKEIRKAAERSTDLTRQLLAFARKQTISPRVLDLNETIEGMLKMLRRLIGEDIDLSWLPGAGVWPVKMDPSQIDQILANLCVNARDAIAGGGKVTIETHTMTFDEVYCADHPGFVPGEYVLLAVSDDGHGIDKETLDKLFEPFFTTKGMGKGTGLGLSTVYGIVKQNNGFINVYSEPGHGTTFKIYLPRHAAKVDQTPKERPAAPAARGHETILLAEDDPALLKLTGTILEKLGYQVLAASTPGEAVRVAKEHDGETHLLITDVVMPKMNGRDLAKTLIALYPGLKHLFMSGYTGNIIVHHGVLDEGENFIQKPFSMQALAAKVREVLDSR
jgi:PAS domain S-box-containing protein